MFRDLGIEHRIRAEATPNKLMGHNVWATSFAGLELARLMTWGSGVARQGDYLTASPCFPLEGEMGLGASMNIWLEADLTKYTEHRPGTLYWMAQPGNDYWVGAAPGSA